MQFGDLNAKQLEALRRNAPTPDDIFANMDELNDELVDFNKQNPHAAPVDPEVDSKTVLAAVKAAKPNKELARKKPALLVKPKALARVKEEPVETQVKEELEMHGEDQLEREAREAEEMLKAFRAQQAEERQQQEPEQQRELTPEERIEQEIMKLLRNHPKAPSEAQIAAWKQAHGDGLQVLALGPQDVYIFTYLKRGQWQHIQKIIQAGVTSGALQNPDEALMEKVIQNTVLFPKGVGSPEFLLNSRAGVVQTLYDQIMLNSYFLQTNQAAMLTMAI